MVKTAPKPATKPVVYKKPASVPAKIEPAEIEDANDGDAALALADAEKYGQKLGREDVAIPRIVILQSNSPQCNPAHGKYLEDARQGMIMNTVTNELWDGKNGVMVVPIAYRRAHYQWPPRGKEGAQTAAMGPAKDWGPVEPEGPEFYRDEKNRLRLYTTPGKPQDKDHLITATAEYIVQVAGQTNFYPAILSMSRTQLKKARNWNGAMRNVAVKHPSGNGFFNPAWFYFAYNLTTVPESNSEGNWFGWSIKQGPKTTSLPGGRKVYEDSKALHELWMSGGITSAPVEAEYAEEAPEDENAPI